MDENGPFIDGLPINFMVIFHGKLLVITRWYPLCIGIVTSSQLSNFTGNPVLNQRFFHHIPLTLSTPKSTMCKSPTMISPGCSILGRDYDYVDDVKIPGRFRSSQTSGNPSINEEHLEQMLQDQEIGQLANWACGSFNGIRSGFHHLFDFLAIYRAGIERAILFGVYTNELDMIPSGKHTTNYGQLQFLMEKSTN